MRFNLPKSNAGRRVGLLGGSFDPAHEGHVRISEQALKRFDLDQVWWLVSPANPLKPQGPAPLDKRVAHAKRLIDHPRIVITDVETPAGHKVHLRQLACAAGDLFHHAVHLAYGGR